MFNILAPLVALLPLALASPLSERQDSDSGFASVCSSWYLSNDGTEFLQASCGGATASINLNLCLGNNDGRLVAQANGGFGASCNDFVTSGTTIYATCPNNAGVYGAAGGVDMNSIIGWDDQNGELYCYGISDDGA